MAKKSKEFGVRLDRLINEREGFNVNRLAAIVGVRPPVIWNYIKEGRIPEAPILYRLAKEFGVTMEFLLTGEDKGNNIVQFLGRRIDNKTRMLIDKAIAVLKDPEAREPLIANINHFFKKLPEQMEIEAKKNLKKVKKMAANDDALEEE